MSRVGRLLRALRHRKGLAAVILAISLTAAVAWQASAAGNSLPAPGWAVTVAPVTALLDGDTVTVNVKANSDVIIVRAEVQECRLGGTYVQDGDTSPRLGNCPPSPVSSSADTIVSRAAANGLISASQSSGGANLNFHVGTGTVNWETPTGPSSLTCDITTQCALVVKLDLVTGTTYQIVPLTFSDADPIVACGGVATGALRAAAADELADGWANWTRAYCADKGTGSPSTTAFTGEGSAVTSFLKGDIDVAYGSAGIDPTTGMILSGTQPRGTVAVPIGLNAAVLAVGGGHRVFVGGVPTTKDPYPQLQMTAADAAALLGNGIPWFQQDSLPYRNSVLVHNPALAGVAYWTSANVLASSLPLTSSWLLSKYFTAVTPTDWVYRRDTPPSVRGASSSFASASPPFTDVTLLTGRPAMGKVQLSATLNDPDGPVWVFTDRATATSLKLTPVALEDPTGTTFVAPDNASMTAAVAGMKANAQGVLQPSIGATTAADGLGTAAVTPYPLTYVEYAFVPAEPLVDSTTCTTRTASQTLLAQWLDYVTGAGQQNMAAGLEPLTPDLVAQAKAAIAKVGQSPVTGVCAGKTTPEAAPGAAPAPPAVSGPTTAVPRAVAGLTAPPASATIAGAPGDAAEAKKQSAVVAIPAFAGHTVADPTGGVIAIIGIVIMMSLAAWITAGGSMAGGGQFTPGAVGPLTGRRVGSYALLWGGVAVAGLGLVLFQLGPLLEQRDQRSLLSDYRVQVKHSAFESQGLGGATTATKAPERGTAVGIVEVSALKLQDVVVEGVMPSQTRQGPGHVPGTAGLGQPGNAVVVARRNGYGGSFAGIGKLQKGDRIVVTTTQGQSVYAVGRVCTQEIVQPIADGSTSSAPSATPAAVVGTDAATVCGTTGGSKGGTSAGAASTSTTAPGATTTTTATGATTTSVAPTTTTLAGTANVAAAAQPAAATKSAGASVSKTAIRAVSVDGLYGASDDDRLTLVTSAEKTPWNASKATIVVAKLLTKPFEPTTQGTRDAGETGFSGDSGAWASVVLCLLGFGAIIVGSVALYRRMRFRIAYLLTIAPLVALTIVTGEMIARLLPAWT